MPHTVRQHTRKTASGGTTTVRQHTRRGGGPKPDKPGGTFGRVRGLLASRRARSQPDQDLGWADEAGPAQEPRVSWRADRDRRRMARTELRAADDALAAVPGREETPEYWAANDRVILAEDRLRRARGKPTPKHMRQSVASARMSEEMRAWRSRPEPTPGPAKPMTPQMATLLGCDTPEGFAKYERGRAYREAGYDGPLDSDNRIPDPDDPANFESLKTLAAMRK
jgi:hypothetical protein